MNPLHRRKFLLGSLAAAGAVGLGASSSEAIDPIRRQARPLNPREITGREIQKLIRDMRTAMRDAPGVGLAAPQVGLPLQLAVIEDRKEYYKEISPEQLAERERLLTTKVLMSIEPRSSSPKLRARQQPRPSTRRLRARSDEARTR